MSCNIAIITSAGRGLRMLSSFDTPKQYMKLHGIEIIRYSLEAFLNHPDIDYVLTVIHADDIELYKKATIGLELLPPVFGGKTRQESVRMGLGAIKQFNPSKVLIHDASRPFVSKKLITNTITMFTFGLHCCFGAVIDFFISAILLEIQRYQKN